MFDVLVHLPFKVNPLFCDGISRICLVAIALTLLGGQPFAYCDQGGSPLKVRPFHCTSIGLTLAITPNVGNSSV